MLNSIAIKQITKIRYLGIIFDDNLRRNIHIKNLVGKLGYSLYKFIKLKHFTYHLFSFYQSIFQYGLLVWGGIKDNYLKCLQSN